MRDNPKPHEFFTHFKGNKYQIVTLADHSESGEVMVVYQAMYGEFKTYVRPLDSFMSEVDHEKYPDVTQKYRFAREEELSERYEAKSSVAENAHSVVKTEVSSAQQDSVSTEETAQTSVSTGAQAEEEEWQLDPLVVAYLEADTTQEKIEILTRLHDRIDDAMINVMAIATDVEIDDGPIEKRYEELKYCLITKEKYEKTRRGL